MTGNTEVTPIKSVVGILPLTGKLRLEFAGFEGVQGAEAGAQVDSAQTALAEEPAEKILCGALLLFRVAIVTAGDEVAVGIAAEIGLRDDVVEASVVPRNPAQAVEALGALALVD